MGLAILGIAFYHAPFIIHDYWLELFHDTLNCGVDLFLFLSGIGACHSIARRGGCGYLRQRAARLLPGLFLFLIPWSVYMLLHGYMNGWELLGSVTLLGWWLGSSIQLNWYFSAVWAFFLLAVPLYSLFRRVRFPILLWAALMVVSWALALLCPLDYLMTAVARLPIFLFGMLFGTWEQRGFRRTGLLRAVLLLMIPVGIQLVIAVNWYGGGYYHGYQYGFWWYPYAFLIPGGAVLIADLAAVLGKSRVLTVLAKPIRWCGESSAEILMIHVGVYKAIMYTRHFRNRIWVCILLGCAALGCLYLYLLLPSLGKELRHLRDSLSERY